MAQNDAFENADWFDQDEDDIVNDFKLKQNAPSGNVEYITDVAEIVKVFEESGLQAPSFGKKIVPTAKLREVVKMTAMDVFLFTSAHERDFFQAQIATNDSMERVLLYLRILVPLIRLEWPGFYVAMLRAFVNSEPLLEHFGNICIKLFNKKYISLWIDTFKVDEIIGLMETLLSTAFMQGITSKKCHIIMQQIKLSIEESDCPTIAERKACKDFHEKLSLILSEAVDEHSRNSEEIYPSLAELFNNCEETTKSSLLTKNYQNTADYIKMQTHLLREDFMISLRECVRSIKTTHTTCSLSTPLMEDVRIVLNKDFLQANRNQLLFADILGNRRTSLENAGITKTIQNYLNSLKTGSLLCFSTSYDFNDLILATVSHSDADLLSKGYISIDILEQCNIGYIYDKQFVMFESPAFFEPYQNVFNVLKYYEPKDMPMQKYIVLGEDTSAAPSYLGKDASYTYNGDCFNPLTQLPRKLPLNDSQTLAYKTALSHEFCLIQGPPGTGKTHLSVEIVKTLIENSRTPVVLITFTNDSLDKFLLKLSTSTTSIVRFGNQSGHRDLAKFNISQCVEAPVNPQLKQLYYDTNMLYKAEFEALQKLYNEFDGSDESYQLIVASQKKLRELLIQLSTIRTLFQYYLVKEKQIIAMTTTCAARNNFLFKLLQSSIVIFEEAAEILESHVLACLTRYTKHVIMIGDHMQLQPYTSSFQHSQTHEMNISLFERLILRNKNNIALSVQFRMRPEIAHLICPVIYKNIENAEVVHSYPQVNKMQKNLFFLAHEEMESCNQLQNSKYNQYECKELLKLAKHLTSKAGYSPKDVVILSPYSKQIEIISKEMHEDLDLREVKVTTVDSFQGMEANIVLLSLVRSNNSGDIGFMREKNRICVALSRAKYGLFIIGNIRLLSQCSKTWEEIQAKLATQEAIGDTFPYA